MKNLQLVKISSASWLKYHYLPQNCSLHWSFAMICTSLLRTLCYIAVSHHHILFRRNCVLWKHDIRECHVIPRAINENQLVFLLLVLGSSRKEASNKYSIFTPTRGRIDETDAIGWSVGSRHTTIFAKFQGKVGSINKCDSRSQTNFRIFRKEESVHRRVSENSYHDYGNNYIYRENCY